LDKVIGLGKTGCAVAEQLTAYPEYRIYKIDAGIEERGSLSLDFQPDHAAYETNIDQQEVEVYLRSIKKKDQVLLIVEGGDPVSGAALRVLETIKDSSLTVLYICPDRLMSSEVQKRDDRVAFNVLQEYARSGVFERIFLVDKLTVESLIGDVSIQEYEKSISYFIAYVVAMINYFDHTDPVLANKLDPHVISRLATFGVSSLEEDKQDIKLLFPLESPRDIHFFYGVPEAMLTEDSSLTKKIKNHVKSYKNEDVSSSFSVYSTSFDDLMVLCVAYSSQIQPHVETSKK
tara:strand:+ start:2890 stop:3756 length:867 start_codon:yes stop_codon:yes gene_type:complete